ncbi:tetratricopeptide repeat protein [Sorangium cellulosum]|uniref:tetratricopeptide repeat protein n=1 Tax=Sorangium cellulosum TaxID=56 RepID=UPI000A53EB08|nr:tetratricopeptide repeat protein [Sorangium cellulosum]
MAEEGEVRKEKRKQSKSLAQDGEVRRKNGQYTDAIRRFTEALEIDGEYAWAYAHRGAARAALDDWEPCCADFQKAVELKPDYGWAYARWGEAHRIHASHRLGRADTPPDWREQHAIIDRGIELLERAAELSPGSAWTFAHRGATYTYKYWLEVMPRLVPALELDNGPTPAPEARSSKGNDAATRALQDLDKARELNPRYAWVCAFKTCVLALIAREQPDMTPGLLAARDCMLDALALDVDERLPIHVAAAKLLSCAGTFRESISSALRAVKKNPADLFSRYFIAVGLKHLNDPLAPVVIEHTRKLLESTRSEIDTMLRGLDVLEGREGGRSIASMRNHLSVEAIALVAFDPTWSDLRTKPLSPLGRRDP